MLLRGIIQVMDNFLLLSDEAFEKTIEHTQRNLNNLKPFKIKK
jgi:hypothetical protein